MRATRSVVSRSRATVCARCCCQARITQRFTVNKDALLHWLSGKLSVDSLASQLYTRTVLPRLSSRASVAPASRQEDEEALKQWLRLDSKQPLVISGPRGTGKTSLLNHALESRHNVVRIDVRGMLEKKEEIMVRRARAVCGARVLSAFFPVWAQAACYV